MTDAYISAKDIRSHVEAYEATHGHAITPGETVRLNHEGCSAGTDTRRRLYITHRADFSKGNVYLVYCHNCGVGGTVTVSGFGLSRGVIGSPSHSVTTPTQEFTLPDGVSLWDEGVPGQAPDFANILAPEDAEWLGVAWNPVTCRVVLPIYDYIDFSSRTKGELIAYQERRIFGNGPKYITTTRDDAPMESIFLKTMATPMVVLVEDWLSAYRVANCGFSCTSVPMLRYQVRPEYLAKLVGAYKNIVVWLDNDKVEVHREAEHIQRLAVAYGAQNVYNVNRGPEPKHIAVNDVADQLAHLRDIFRK